MKLRVRYPLTEVRLTGTSLSKAMLAEGVPLKLLDDNIIGRGRVLYADEEVMELELEIEDEFITAVDVGHYSVGAA